MTSDAAAVWLEEWDESGLDLLRRANAPELMVELGGPESEELLLARHRRYLDGWRTGRAHMFRVLTRDAPHGAGAVGYWDLTWQGAEVSEAGWTIDSPFQGRGIATAAVTAMLRGAEAGATRRHVHAFPKLTNAPSNAVCRKAGFALLGECELEYPPGHVIQSNDWAFDLEKAYEIPIEP